MNLGGHHGPDVDDEMTRRARRAMRRDATGACLFRPVLCGRWETFLYTLIYTLIQGRPCGRPPQAAALGRQDLHRGTCASRPILGRGTTRFQLTVGPYGCWR
jgi:hypothetical protein